MSIVRLTPLLVCLLAPAVSAAADGGAHLYLDPLPQGAARLTFTIASVSAVTRSGSEQLLDLRQPTVGQAENSRQRLLASGLLPAGDYAGFTLTIKRAALKAEQGDVALLVPEEPVRLPFPFVVSGQKAFVFRLSFKFEGSISSGVAFSPLFTVAFAPRPIVSQAGFVSNSESNTVTVFDKRTQQAAAVIPTCGEPAGLALDQRAGRLYVACSRDDEIQAFDAAAGELLDRSRLIPGDGPRELALTPDGRTLLSVNTRSNSVNVLDAPSLIRQDRITVGNGPGSIVVDPAGRRAYVFNTHSSSISVIDIAGRSVVATIATDPSPLRGQFSARGDRLFVIHERSPYLTVVDPGLMAVLSRSRLRLGITAIKVDSRRGLLYIGGRSDAMIEVYDPQALVPIDAIKIRRGVSHMTIDDAENRLYVVSPATRSLIIAALGDRKPVSEIDVGAGPGWVAVMGER